MMCYDLMSTEDLYDDSTDVEGTSDINEESVLMPTTNNRACTFR
jgi:hypothetical protein